MPNAPPFASVFLRIILRAILGAGCGLFCFLLITLTRGAIAYQTGGFRAVLDLNYPGLTIAMIVGAGAAQFWPKPRARENQAVPTFSEGQSFIITVHGTAAAHASDEGTLWWQRNSPFHLAMNLETGAENLVQPFHWSGANSEVSRRSAARELQSWIESLESHGTPYHLIAHSHGGNVAWEALRRALRSRRNLTGLRSWTTVGTPFFQFQFARPELGRLLPLVIAIFLFTAPYTYPAIPNMWRQTLLLRPVMVAYTGQWMLPLLVLTLTAITALLAASIVADLAFKFFALAWNARQKEKELHSYRALQDRHVAIRSMNDEAIAGLAGALILEQSDLSILPRLPALNTGFLGKLFSPFTWPAVALYNRTAVPWFNTVLRRRLRDRMHGNPFRLYDVRTVAPTVAGALQDRGRLSEKGEREIAEFAASGAASTVVGLRTALGGFAVGSDLAVFRDRLSENFNLAGLVHNSYFKCTSVIHTIANCLRGDLTDLHPAPSAPAPHIPGVTVNWPQALVFTALLLACYASAAFIFISAVEPNTLAGRTQAYIPAPVAPGLPAGNDAPQVGKIGGLIADADRLARSVGLEESRLWYAVKCVAGSCNSSGPDVDPKAGPTDLGSLRTEEFAGLIEAIRWSSACTAPNCGRRDQLIATLERYLRQKDRTLFRRKDLEEAAKGRYFLTTSEQLYLIASRLGGTHRTPSPKPGAAFTKLPEDKLRSFIADAAKEEERHAMAGASRDLLAGLYYLQPFFDLSLTPAQIQTWDRDVSPSARLDNKLLLASGMHCGYERQFEPRAASVRERAVRPLERIQAEITSNYLWWGECQKHAAVARSALLAAEADWRASQSNGDYSLLTARYLEAIDGLLVDLFANKPREAPEDPALLALSKRVQQEFEKSLSTSIAEKDLDTLLRLLTERAESQPIAANPGGNLDVESAIIDLTDWDKPPMAQLVALLCASSRGGCELPPRRTKPRFSALTDKIVAETANRSEVYPSTERAMFDFFTTHGHIGLRTRYFDALQFSHAEHARRFMAYNDATILPFAARELYGQRRDPGEEAPIFGNKTDTEDLYRSIERYTQFDFAEAEPTLDVISQSRIFAALAVGAVADNRFHAAIDYARKARILSDQLRAFSEILASWQAVKEQIGQQHLDELLDQGDKTLQESIDRLIRKNPSH